MKNQDSKNSKNDKRRVFWQVHLDAWRDTGLTQAAYCRKNNLRANQFTYWKKQISQPDLPVKFVQVPEANLKTVDSIFLNEISAPCLRLCVSSRFTIEIPDGFSPETLTKTLMVLQEV